MPSEGYPPSGSPGRLATSRFRSSSASTTNEPGAQYVMRPGMAGVRGQVPVNTFEHFLIHRGSFRSHQQYSVAVNSRIQSLSGLAGRLSHSVDYSQGYDGNPGPSCLSDRNHSIDQVAYERPPDVLAPTMVTMASKTGFSSQKGISGSVGN